MATELGRYLEDMRRHLRVDPARQDQVVRELYTHLEDRVRDLESQGLPHEEAVLRATRGLGQPGQLASRMYRVHGRGTWHDAMVSATPHLAVSLIFAAHLWQSVGWIGIFLGASVAMTLFGWWRGKPHWMYPWAGYSLALPLISGIIAAVAVGQGGWGLSHGQPLEMPLWVFAGLLSYIPLASWMLLSVSRQVIRRDWIFLSLMALPIPILARWLLSLQWEGSALVYSKPELTIAADQVVALVFLGLAVVPVLFVRLKQRPLKIIALVIATPPSFVVAATNIPGSRDVPWVMLSTMLAVAFLLAPALLDLTMGHASHDGPSLASRRT